MKIALKNYDIQAARDRIHAFVSIERNLVYGTRGYEHGYTKQLRRLTDSECAMHRIARLAIDAAVELPYNEGGTARPTGPEGEWVASPDDLRIDLPLARALLTLRGHPCFGSFAPIDFRNLNQPGKAVVDREGRRSERVPFVPGGPYDAAPILERLFTKHPTQWSTDGFLSLVSEAAFAAFGDQEIDSDWMPNQIHPGSRIAMYAKLWFYTMLYEAAGAIEPSYTRANALSGEWWLIQPVSPRLNHWELATRLGFDMEGYLPPSAVDALGRVVMVCYPQQELEDTHRFAQLADSKWAAGAQKVLWTKGELPLALPDFDLIGPLEGITEDSYGPYKHSSELPAWPPSGGAE